LRTDLILKAGVWALGIAPALWAGIRLATGGLGANPIEALLLVSGRWALIFLLIGLAVTPVRRLTGWNRIIKVRRLLGLFAFFYATLHLLMYLVVDQGLAWSFILEDVLERPFITVGFGAFLFLVPLAITSTKGWIRRLGKRWALLHRLVYVATSLGVLHFYWKVKADTFWPLVAALVLGVLLAFRVSWPAIRPAGHADGSRSGTPVPAPEEA
jgi:sulfoxide reductase heme-binding subunit YedZ